MMENNGEMILDELENEKNANNRSMASNGNININGNVNNISTPRIIFRSQQYLDQQSEHERYECQHVGFGDHQRQYQCQ